MGSVPLAAQEGKVRVVELVVNGVFHDVLDDRGPPGHLVGLLAHALLPLCLPNLSSVSLKK